MPRFELDRLVSYDDEALLAELRRVASIVASPYVTKSAFDHHSKAHSSTVARRFGGWDRALTRAGLADRFSQAPKARRVVGRTFTDEALLAELRTVAAKGDGGPVTIELFNQHADMNAETVRRRFGSWWAALKRAGLPISNLGKRYSEDDYFENLLQVWTHHGRQPTYGEMDESPSSISSGAYEGKWGTWTKALLAFVTRINSDSESSDLAKPSEPNLTGSVRRPRYRRVGRVRPEKENRRQPTLGLRYQVLSRDRFRCVSCGRSPATHVGCVLHVDHILPFSRGGKTVAANLRTFCQSCNLGKGARLEGDAPAG
ncbi:MAG TPA: HNH endonuclease [Rhodothermales bacterium]|nr:HNH endonuclease [Rhodothermales bacterium]